MADDIVARLRNQADWLEVPSETMRRAADEIERLRKNSGKTFCALLATGKCDKIDEIERLRAALLTAEVMVSEPFLSADEKCLVAYDFLHQLRAVQETTNG